MKVPEKIFLYPYSTDGIYEVETKPLEGTVEYTRTDAFIEKAVNYLNCNLSGVVAIKKGNTTQGLLRTTSEFIEEFKKFMKGE